MKLELEFHDSEISEVKVGAKELEICFSSAVIIGSHPSEPAREPRRCEVPATILIGTPKYKSLPKKGKLADGELYGIPGKALNGRIPINYKFERSIELEMSNQSSEFIVHGKSIRITADLSKLPDEMKPS